MRVLFFILSFFFAALSSHAEEINLAHNIPLPAEYSAGCEIPVNCQSSASYYVDMYELGWWHCVGKLAKDLDYIFKPEDSMANGGAVSIAAFSKGCDDGQKHISNLLLKYSKKAVSKYLNDNVTFFLEYSGT